jgi:hypothetical protein
MNKLEKKSLRIDVPREMHTALKLLAVKKRTSITNILYQYITAILDQQ